MLHPHDLNKQAKQTMNTFQALGLVLAVFVSQAHAASYSFTPFDVPGASATAARGINNAGQVVGGFGDSSGLFHGFVASPVPLPAAVWLLGTTLGGLGFVRRRLV